MPRTDRLRDAPLAVAAVAVLVAGIGAAAAALPEPPVASPAPGATGPSGSSTPPPTGPSGSPSPVAPGPSGSPASDTAPAGVRTPVPVRLAVQPPPPAPALPHDPGDPETWSHRQLAAQLVVSCVQSVNLGTAVAHAQAGIGGVVVMGRPGDGPALAADLARARAAAPDGVGPLVASDEEGGQVQRLRDLLGRLPPASTMGTWPDERIERTAHGYGVGMRALGVQLALSPVADLAAPGRFLTRERRTFSGDPHRAAAAAMAWSRGLERAGVLSAPKHWPGHGSAADSHTAAPETPPLAELAQRDLVPFDALLSARAPLVMVGHLRTEGLTEPGLPATLSPNALRVLRERAGPRTVLLTDSLSMAASSSALGLRPAEAAVRSLQAGADWAMVCVDALPAVDAVEAALDAGALPRPAAVASARRVLEVKQRLGLLAVPPTTAPPTGAVDGAQAAGPDVTLSGRAADPDTPEPVRLQVLVGGTVVTEVVADGGLFAVTVPAPPGAPVCAVALNTGIGRATALGCATRPRGAGPDGRRAG